MFLPTSDLKKNSVNNNNSLPAVGISIDISERCENMCASEEEEDVISRLCMPMCSRDEHASEIIALDVIEKTVEDWWDGYGSPQNPQPRAAENHAIHGLCCGDNNCSEGINNEAQEYLSLVTLRLPTIHRLSFKCPFQDIKDTSCHILQVVQTNGDSPRGSLVVSDSDGEGGEAPNPPAVGSYWISAHCLPCFSISPPSSDDEDRGACSPFLTGPSSFIPPDELPQLESDNDETHMLFIDAFLQNNRLDHVSQVMGYHPMYLDIFLRTQYFIVRGDGPLPFNYRHYIAIMAAARHQCSYLINMQKQEFLLQGGDQNWLKGLSKIPKKLRDLYDINKILAHRPWLLNKSHIEKLTKGENSWSLAEVVHAIVLLVHFHCLASFVFGCGVNEELEQDEGCQTSSSPSPSNSNGSQGSSPTPVLNKEVTATEQEVGVDTLMHRMKCLSERAEEFSQEERMKRFEHVENQSVDLSPGETLAQVKSDIGCFVEDPTFQYEDFARRGKVSDISTFRIQDYSWDDHGYSLVNRLYNDVGKLLDVKFKITYNLTYNTMGGRKDVDTSRFRRAIWNYIQCMFGIRHDDYDYGEVNQLLERSLKTFIKSACCYPERITKKDYDRVLREFKHSEKVHVNLMVLEARLQAEMLYAMRAVMRYTT